MASPGGSPTDPVVDALDRLANVVITTQAAVHVQMDRIIHILERDFDRLANLLAVIGNISSNILKNAAQTPTAPTPSASKSRGRGKAKSSYDAAQKVIGDPRDANKLIEALERLGTSFVAQTQHIVSFVAAANPAAILQFQLALRDTVATIGNILTPVLNTATDIIRAFGSAIASLGPNAKQMIQVLAGGTLAMGVFAAAVTAFEAVATGGIGPVIAGLVGAAGAALVLSDGVSGLRGVFASVGDFLSTMADVLKPSFDVLAKAVGQLAPLLAQAAGGIVGTIAQLLVPLFSQLATAFSRLVPAVAPAIEALTKIGEAMAGYLVARISSWFSVLVPLGELVAKFGTFLLANLAEPIMQISQVLAGVFEYFMSFIAQVLSSKDVISILTLAFQASTGGMLVIIQMTGNLAVAFVKIGNILIDLYNKIAPWILSPFRFGNIKLPTFESQPDIVKQTRRPADIGVRDVGTTSLEAITQTALVDALRSSFGRKNKDEEIAAHTKEAADELKKLNEKVGGANVGIAKPPEQAGPVVAPGQPPLRWRAGDDFNPKEGRNPGGKQ